MEFFGSGTLLFYSIVETNVVLFGAALVAQKWHASLKGAVSDFWETLLIFEITKTKTPYPKWSHLYLDSSTFKFTNTLCNTSYAPPPY